MAVLLVRGLFRGDGSRARSYRSLLGRGNPIRLVIAFGLVIAYGMHFAFLCVSLT
ncbi:MAG: hypothetical protein HKN47_14210 [Pirellulaceae bacterium]|nr:hypothetical protein [Pirellulaceae bacterium]